MLIKKRAKISEAEKIAKQIKNQRSTVEPKVLFINTGCTMLNLALSGKGLIGGFARSHVANIVGDGSTGKTLIALETAATNFYSPLKGKTTKIVYNNPEVVMDFPLEEMFGHEFTESVDWRNEKTIEAFGRDFTNECMNIKKDESIIYIIDSWDALKSDIEEKAFLKEAATGKEQTSKMLVKQQYAHEFFRNICSIMEDKDITLLIISQVKQKIDARFGKKTYRTGGKALDFFTHQVVWLYEKRKLQKIRRGRSVVYGVEIRAKVERNKVAKPYREAEFSILFDYGIDNIGSMLDWYYGPQAKNYNFDGEKIKGRDNIIKYIEDQKKIKVLTKMVIKEWREVEDAVRPDRRRKFP